MTIAPLEQPDAFTLPIFRLLSVVLMTCALSGCVNYHGIGSDQQARSLAQLVSSESLQTGTGSWPSQNWWEAFHDETLNALMADALTDSPLLAAAAARVDAANAALESSHAQQLPSFGADASATYQRYTENGLYPAPLGGAFKSSGDIRLGARYELDFWGRNRAAVAAARSQSQAAQAEAASARLLLTSAVAKTYFELAQWQAFRHVGASALQQRERILELTHQRVAAGLDSQVEQKQAETQLPLMRGLLAQLDEKIENTQHALAALIGAGPDRALRIVANDVTAQTCSTENLPTLVPDKLSINLLGRRPDIVAARWQVEASLHSIDAGRAAFYPNINLGAFVGLSSIGLDQLLQSGSSVYGAGPALSLPLFDGGRLRAALKTDYAAYDAAVANYNQTLIYALRDVADQLTSYRALQPQLREQQAALSAAQGSLDLAVQRYHAGLGNYLTVLSAETAVFSQQVYAAQLHSREHTLRVELFRALGGGFLDQSDAQAAPSIRPLAAGENHE